MAPAAGAGGVVKVTVSCVGRPTSELELAKNRLPDPKCFWPGFPGRDCAKIQILRGGEILGIWCTYRHPPLKRELNAAKTRVTTVPSYPGTGSRGGISLSPNDDLRRSSQIQIRKFRSESKLSDSLCPI